MTAPTTALRRLASRRRARRFVPVAAGPGAGLLISHERASADYAPGTNELPVQEAMQRWIRRGDIVFDVGANVGFFSLLAARLVGPGGRVVAFEPVPDNVVWARANARRNGFDHLEVMATAVGASTGHAELLLTRHPGGATVCEGATDDEVLARIEVPMVALDELVELGAVPAPSFVKIDVEGAEAEVLSGMGEILACEQPVVLCELDAPDPEAVDRRVAAISETLRGHAYEVQVLDRSYEDGAWCVRHLVAVAGGRPW
jgi:FkbM family methyltransferase